MTYTGPTEIDLAADPDIIRDFLHWWFGACNQGYVELGWTDQAGAITLFRRFPLSAIDEAARFAAETNGRCGNSMYFRGATVRPDSANTHDTDVLQIPGFWTDCDEEDAVWLAQAIDDIPASAHVITGRTPHERGQFLWHLGEPILVPNWVRMMNARIADRVNGDPAVVNPARLMRLPGCIAWPWKKGRVPELVELADGTRSTYTLETCRHALGIAAFPSAQDQLFADGDSAPARVNRNGAASDAAELLNPVRALIEQAKAGPHWHDPVLRLVAHLVSRGTPDAAILAMAPELTWSGYTAEQTRNELRVMIDSAKRKGFAPDEAERGEVDIDDVMNVEPKAPTLFPLLTDADLAALPDPEWLVPDIIAENSLAVLYGTWATFKSFVALDISLRLATGRPWLGKPVKKVDTLYIAGEGVAGLKLRVAAWKLRHGITEPIAGFRAVPLVVNLMDQAEAERLVLSVLDAQKAAGFHPKLVVCDTLARAMPGAEESTKKDMSIAIANADLIRRKLDGATFLPIHHCGKDEARGMRGSSDLPGSADTIIRATRPEGGMIVELLVEKQKDGEDRMQFCLQAEKIDLPPAAGSLKPRSSLVLVEADAKPDPEAKPKERAPLTTKAYRRALRILIDMVRDEGVPLPMAPGFPDDLTLRGVWVNRWREVCRQRCLSASEDQRAQNQAFQRAVENLLDEARITICEGWVWLTQP
ncbi:MAG TPA: AAA family ATPase [Stellaceae bacterium]|nr:AAA family ATPase [Stellaceae bacterium]